MPNGRCPLFWTSGTRSSIHGAVLSLLNSSLTDNAFAKQQGRRKKNASTKFDANTGPVECLLRLTDWLSSGFKSHSSQNRSFRRRSFYSQSLGLVLKKLNLTQENRQHRSEHNDKTNSKFKSKVNLNQQSTLRTAHMCAYALSLCTTVVRYRTVLIIFSLMLRTIITARMLSFY